MSDLFTKLLIAFLAPAGIWFGWYLQRRDKAADRASEKRKLLRDKAELIYRELQNAQNEVRRKGTEALRGLYGMPLAEREFAIDPLETVKALFYMYFPSAEAILEEHDRNMYIPISESADEMNKHGEGSAADLDERAKRAKETKLKFAKEELRITLGTIVKLRHHLNEQVKTLL